MNPRRLGAGALATVLLTGVVATGQQHSANAIPMSSAALDQPRTVTLVTGDRVTVDGERVSAEAGPGRNGMTFVTTTTQGHVRVVPTDAGPLLAAGRLDSRLFDVTGLLAYGYDRRDDLPLILTGHKGSTVSGVSGLAKERDLPAIRGVAVRQPNGKAADSWRALTSGASMRSNVSKVWLDGVRQPSLDVSVPQIGAPTAWEAGFTGAGSTVAVLDSGIDATHPDLVGQVVTQKNFTDGYESDEDFAGHGTHVASTIAGTGAASGGRKGVAPGGKLLDGKVCGQGGCAESWIIAGMTWAAAEQHAKVVNLSLGGEDDPNVIDPVEEAIQTLSDQHGTLFVVSAGNADGVTEGAIDSPGSAPAAMTVGAVDREDALANFSRRGPGAPNDSIKPDITAPGVRITAAWSKDAAPSELPDGRYESLSGTSMAAPHVAGAAAILAQQHPTWSGQQLKAALMASAKPNPAYGVYAQGAGRVDVARAVGQTVSSRTTSLSFGRQSWPHQDDEVLSQEVTYHNDGPSDVTLALRPDVVDAAGAPLPAGVFTVERATVVVPAGGDASVTVNVDTSAPGPEGLIGGWLTATAGDLSVRTPMAVNKEAESYEVTLIHRDRAGATPQYFTTSLSGRGSDRFDLSQSGPDPDDTLTMRVPKGHYSVQSFLKDTSGLTMLSQPDLEVSAPVTVDLDARLGQPVSVSVEQAGAQQIFSEMAAYSVTPHGSHGIAVLGESFANMFTGQIGPDVEVENFYSIIAGQWARADANGSTDDSPYFYSLFYPEPGRMVTGYRRAVANASLATVRADFALAQPDTYGYKRVRSGFVDSGVNDFDTGNFGPFLRVSLPFTRTEYYNTDPGVGSSGDFEEWSEEAPVSVVYAASPPEYVAGRTYHERWNRGVFSPPLPPTDFLWRGVTRTGDTLQIELPAYGDGDGRGGASVTTSAGTALFRNGTKLADRAGSIPVPAGEATYRLETRTARGAPFVLSTRVETVRTFRSGHVDSGTLTVPLWSVRFSPNLNERNMAPANRVFPVPVAVAAQPGSDAGTVVNRTVEVSFDDGVTWRRVRLKGSVALVPHPAGSGFVSLRAGVTDSEGNTVKQTVIRAYRY